MQALGGELVQGDVVLDVVGDECPIFIGLAQRFDVGGEPCQPFRDLLDDGAELGAPVGVGLAQFGGTQVDLGERWRRKRKARM